MRKIQMLIFLGALLAAFLLPEGISPVKQQSAQGGNELCFFSVGSSVSFHQEGDTDILFGEPKIWEDISSARQFLKKLQFFHHFVYTGQNTLEVDYKMSYKTTQPENYSRLRAYVKHRSLLI